MANAPLCPDGWYLATAERVELGQTTDRMVYVEAECRLRANTAPRTAEQVNNPANFPVRILWRGSTTRGAVAKTSAALEAMGVESTYPDGTKSVGTSVLEGAKSRGTRTFRVYVESVECDDHEAYGKWRTFVTKIEAIEL